MDLQHVRLYAEYGSAALYGIGLLGFWLFALSLIKTSVKHFAACAAVGVVWPIFIIVALFRQKKTNSQAPQYVEIKRRK